MSCKRKSLWLLTFIWSIVLPCPFYGPSAKGDVNLVELAKKIRPAVVLIETFDKDKKALGQGSGFFINNKVHLITNHHVIEGAHSAIVKTMGEKTYHIKGIIAKDARADIVKLLVDATDSNVPILKLTNVLPSVGEDVAVVGSPLGLESTVSKGIVSAVRKVPTFGYIVQISAPISPGSSGSPVLNMKGQVIGVATFILTEGQALNFAVPSANIFALKTEKKPTSLPKYVQELTAKAKDEAEKLYDAGYKKAMMGKWLEALAYYEKAIKIKPDDGWGYYFIAVTYDALGRYEEAVEAYKQAIRIDPNNSLTYCFLADAYGQSGRYEEAIQCYRQAVRIAPDFSYAHFRLALAYHISGCYEEATQAYKQAIRIDPSFALAHYSLGLTYLTMGDTGSALDEYKILKTLDEDLADKLFNLIYK